MEKPRARVFDLDGTLVDVRGIRHLIAGEGFDAFHRASATCPPNDDVIRAARKSADDGVTNLVFTGRMERYRSLSVAWLRHHGVPYTRMWMRADEDYRADFIIKKHMFQSASRIYNIVDAWDDRPEIVDLWNHLGVPVTVVPGWE